MKNFNIKIFSEFSEELMSSWKEVEQKSDISVFQTFDINKYWYSIFRNHNELKLQVAVIYKEEESIAIFPFIVRNTRFSKILEFIGSRQFDYKIPLIKNEYNTYLNLINIWQLITLNIDHYDVIFFQSLPEKLSSKKPNLFLNLFNSRVYMTSYALSLPEKIEDKNKIIPKKIIADSKRQIKRLENLGTLEFNTIKSDMEYLEAIDVLIKYKQDQYRDTGATDIFSNQKIKKFYVSSKNNSLVDLEIKLSVLQLDNKIIAAHWGLTYKNVFYYLIPSYDKSMRIYSPGRLLMNNLIEESINRKFEIFDLTIGAEEYKQKYLTMENNIHYVLKLVSYKAIIFYIYTDTLMRIKSSKMLKSFIRRLKKIIVN